MANERDPAQYAADIDAARQRLLAFAHGCGDADWHACVLDGDPRPVGVVVDHVADSYEYLAGWIREVAAGQNVAVSPAELDAGDGRVRRFAEISIRHADNHRSEMRDALAAAS